MNQEKQGIAHHRGAVRPFGTVVADSAVQNNMLSSFHQMQTICEKSEVDVPATGADPCERKFLHLNLMFLASEKTCIRAAQRGGRQGHPALRQQRDKRDSLLHGKQPLIF